MKSIVQRLISLFLPEYVMIKESAIQSLSVTRYVDAATYYGHEQTINNTLINELSSRLVLGDLIKINVDEQVDYLHEGKAVVNVEVEVICTCLSR